MLINVAVDIDTYNHFTARKFMECLDALNWVKGQSMISAIQFFNVMCANDCFCPVLAKLGSDCLCMTWTEGSKELDVYIYNSKREIHYNIFNNENEVENFQQLTLEEAMGNAELWASYLRS